MRTSSLYYVSKRQSKDEIPTEFRQFTSLIQLADFFHDEEDAKTWLAEQRWGKGEEQDVVCPHCGKHHCKKSTDGRYYCSHCHHRFSEKSGTMFENCKISLRQFFMAIYMLCESTDGVTSLQLSQSLGITQSNAWNLSLRIKTFMDGGMDMFGGELEVDEAYIGGVEKFKHENRRQVGSQGGANKQVVFGIAMRGTEENPQHTYQAQIVSNNQGRTLLDEIRKRVAEGSTIYTDESNVYGLMERSGLYNHEVVNHHEREFARGNVTTNHVEASWMMFRRFLSTHMQISDRYMQLYLNECMFSLSHCLSCSAKKIIDLFLSTDMLHVHMTQRDLFRLHNNGKPYYKDVNRVKHNAMTMEFFTAHNVAA